MKCLSVKQPWAGLIQQGPKIIETRTWATPYRGDLVIVSSKKPVFDENIWQCPSCFSFGTKDDFDVCGAQEGKTFCNKCNREVQAYIVDASAGGVTMCVAKLVDCRPMTLLDQPAARCGFYTGAFAWVLEDIRKMLPSPVRGALGIFEKKVPGVCRVCGCTDGQACPGGCEWADENETICSRCV